MAFNSISYAGDTVGLRDAVRVDEISTNIANGNWVRTGLGAVADSMLVGSLGSMFRGSLGKGVLADANFAQPKIRANEVFSAEGIDKYSKIAGHPINTVDDLAAAITKGEIKPSQIPVDYVVAADGTKLILNTRTSVALDRAGVPKSDWYGINRTGIQVPKMQKGITYDDLARQQLERNKLPPTGTPNMPTGRK
jgi:filamentous hemagglutinin